MSRNALTDEYLDEVRRRGVDPTDLPARAGVSPRLRTSIYGGRCLSRPAFLDRTERAQLEVDLRHLHGALTALPDRLFDGDLAAFAYACGATEPQVSAVLRAGGRTPGRLARADLYHDGTGFRLMELNMGSSIGGLDNALLNPVLLDHPVVARFVADHGLSYVDSIAEFAMVLHAASGVPAGEPPLIALADWPASFPELEGILRNGADALVPYGVDVIPCHLGQLSVSHGRVWLDGRPIDLLWRIFLIEDLLDPASVTLIEPLLRAADRGELTIFTPIDVELYGSKAALAMLSDEANRHRFDADQLHSLDRLLPWTRMVQPGHTTVDGEKVELRAYAVRHRTDLVLKPAMMHGGLGVVLGWQVDEAEWCRQLDAAMGGPYVVQRRIRPVPELFPATGGLEPWLVRLGVFTFDSGYGGTIVSASRDLTGTVSTSLTGATLGCCFHEPDPADPPPA